MWFFSSPQIVFGEQALSSLSRLQGKRFCIVTDVNLTRLGFVERVKSAITCDCEIQVFNEVEPDPSLATVCRGRDFLLNYQPDWIIALGGGSVMDTAKAMWILYENPTLEAEAINPVDTFRLRQKARLVAIPTTSGTGSEVTWAIVLTDVRERRKLTLGNREAIADYAILDPSFVIDTPPQLTADTALDAFVHAIEGYTTTWHNDFCDGLCLKAIELILKYLPVAFQNGNDEEARSHLQNAAAIAGLGFGNAMAGLAHGMGHSLGAVFHIPHGRAVALFLPYTIEYCVRGDIGTRYGEICRFLGLPEVDEAKAADHLIHIIRDLQRKVKQPSMIRDCGISEGDFENELELLVQNALNDSQTIMATRIPDDHDLRILFRAAYNGTSVAV